MTEHNEATTAHDQKDVGVWDFDSPMGPMDSERGLGLIEPVFASAESANEKARELVEVFKAGILAEKHVSLTVDPKQPASATADKDEVKNGLASCTRKIALVFWTLGLILTIFFLAPTPAVCCAFVATELTGNAMLCPPIHVFSLSMSTAAANLRTRWSARSPPRWPGCDLGWPLWGREVK